MSFPSSPVAAAAMPTATVPYASSLRSVPVETTWERAQALGARLGITRIVDTTRLDRVGIPVFASIRPTALPGSLCVNAGKGVSAPEARVGAMMEAIEYALAEPNASPYSPKILDATARDVLDGRTRPEAVLDLCPRLGSPIDLDAPLACVEAEDIATGKRWLLPAARAFVPPPKPRNPTEQAFGFSTNGLASGNSLLEATVHGLAEVIERDVTSFQYVRATSRIVRPSSFPPVAAALAEKILGAGLRLWVHAVPNPFDIPYFAARILDKDDPSPYYHNAGYGCHPHQSIALIRALCEAAQSRLSFIHGGRDDLVDHYRRVGERVQTEPDAYDPSHIERKNLGLPEVALDELIDHSTTAPDIESVYRILSRSLERVGADRILRLVFTPPDAELHVVKVIVPRLEEFTPASWKVGRRLERYVYSLRGGSL